MRKIYCQFAVALLALQAFAGPPPAPPPPSNLVTTTTGSLTSAQLAGMLTDETGTGAAVCFTNPIFDQIVGVGATTLYPWPSTWDVVQMGAGDDTAYISNNNTIIGFVQGMYTTDGIAWQYSQTGEEVCLVDANAGYFVVHTQDAGTEDGTVNMSTWHNFYFDYNGNVGVDAVPDLNWYDDWSVVEIGGNAAVLGRRTEGASGTLNTLQNAYFNGSVYKYISTDEASMTYQSGGVHGWRAAASGTAGDTITWTNIFQASKAGISFLTDIGINDTKNVIFGTTSGSQIGTAAAQKIGFWGATPVIQPASTGETVGFTAGIGTGVNDDSTFTGNVGSTAYRISDVVKALKQAGILAQ